MTQLKLRFAQPEESQQILEWLNMNPDNKFTGDILKYPSLRILCSYNEHGAIAYLPEQKVMMLESVALFPYAKDSVKAQALRDLVKGAELLASAEQIKEIYFLDGGGGVGELALNHGFEEVNMRVFRMKL